MNAIAFEMGEKVAKAIGWTTFIGVHTGNLFARHDDGTTHNVTRDWNPWESDADAFAALDEFREQHLDWDWHITLWKYGCIVNVFDHESMLPVVYQKHMAPSYPTRAEAICRAILAAEENARGVKNGANPDLAGRCTGMERNDKIELSPMGAKAYTAVTFGCTEWEAQP